uniref:Uncharacterized protein n=1 Tax=Esox lucius TaxID=8010 RepID=A0AAY5KU27_ESOLU
VVPFSVIDLPQEIQVTCVCVCVCVCPYLHGGGCAGVFPLLLSLFPVAEEHQSIGVKDGFSKMLDHPSDRGHLLLIGKNIVS